tara:strand:+ start:9513 stop:10172 length:660 start_codon:yes stop_codon:yes gene_type:complete
MMSVISTGLSRLQFIKECVKSSLSVLIFLTLTTLANAETIEVSIKKMLFVPETITVNIGDVVRWVNKERRQYHSVWFEALGEPEPDYFFPGEFFEKRFLQAGSYPYRCGPHPEMIGTVVVLAQSNDIAIEKKDMPQDRQAELEYLVKQDCGSCHGMTLKGGLGPSLLPERLNAFSVDDLSAVILEGRPGTPMPPWKGILNSEDASWIARYLKAGSGVQP